MIQTLDRRFVSPRSQAGHMLRSLIAAKETPG